MTQLTVRELAQQTRNLSLEEMRELNSTLCAMIKGKRAAKASSIRATLRVGSIVQWKGNSKDPGPHQGKITRFKVKTCCITQTSPAKSYGYRSGSPGTNWTCYLSGLTLIEY